MASQKLRKITKIVKEFVKTGSSYEITGLELSLCKFFWRESQELFQDLATGDYRIDQSNGKNTLIITNAELLSKAEAFQVGYVLDFEASKYETQWNVDINTLKDKYNQLVEDSQNLWEYVRRTGIISDDTTMDLILPQLDNEQLWYFADGAYRALDLADFRELGERLIEAYVEFQKSVIELMLRNARENIEMTRDNGIKEIQGLLNALNLNIDNFTGTKKVELQKIINDFRASLEGIAIGNANSLGGITADKYQLKQDNGLQTVAKTVVGAINELNEDVVDLNDAIDELEFSKVGAEDTIASLRASSKYKLGDVVEVLGFHTKGDGSHHKRIAKAEDDGSGEQGQGGIWWCIVHNGEVNVSWFGAKGGKFVDSFEHFSIALNYCRANKIALIVSEKYLCRNTLDFTSVRVVGTNKPVASFITYTSKNLGYIGWNYFTNTGNGSQVTSENVFDEAISGSCIYNDTTTLATVQGSVFDIENLGIFGYLRTKNVSGLVQLDGSSSYIAGNHKFKDVNVQGFDSHGIHLTSLEVTSFSGSVSANHGNGIRIEKIQGKDCPFEYVNFTNCSIRANRLDGIYSNTFRKAVKFDNTCNFNQAGQYEMYNYTGDGYDRNPYNKDFKELYSAIKIEDAYTSPSETQTIGIQLVLDGVYSEQTHKLLHVVNRNGIGALNFTTIKNCYFIQPSNPHPDVRMAYIDVNYMQGFEIKNNSVNSSGNKAVLFVSPVNVEGTLDYTYNDIEDANFNATKTFSFIDRFNDMNACAWTIHDNGTSSDVIVDCNVAKDIWYAHYTNTSYSPTFLTFLVSVVSRASNATINKQAFITYFKDNRGKYRVKTMFDDTKGITVDEVTGTLKITTDAWCVVGIQRLDMTKKYNARTDVAPNTTSLAQTLES